MKLYLHSPNTPSWRGAQLSFYYHHQHNHHHYFSRNRGGFVGIATRLRAGRPGFDSQQGLRISLFTTVSRSALGPPSLLSILPNGYQGLFPWVESGRCVKLTTHLHLAPRLSMRGAIHPFPQHVFMVLCLVNNRDNFNLRVVPLEVTAFKSYKGKGKAVPVLN